MTFRDAAIVDLLRAAAKGTVGVTAETQSVVAVLLDTGVLSVDTEQPSLPPVHDFDIVYTNDYLHPFLELPADRPVLLAKTTGQVTWCGPWIGPASSPCFRCLRLWLATRRWQQLAVEAHAVSFQADGPVARHDPWLESLLQEPGMPQALDGTIVTRDKRTGDVERHELRTHRLCGRCKPLEPAPLLSLHSNVNGLLREITVSHEPVANLYQSRGTAFLPLPAPGARDLLRPVPVAGAGATLEAALESCIAEAVERYCTVFVGDEPMVLAPCGHASALDPRKLTLSHPPRVSDGQILRHRTAHSLVTGQARLVPAGCVHLCYSFRNEPAYSLGTSNGCAAGRTLEEAQWRALLELVERDALAIWWYNRLHRPALHLASPPAAEYLLSKGRALYFLDLTNDLEIPVVAAIAPLKDGTSPWLATAAGGSYEEAASKAASELIQMFYWSQSGSVNAGIASWLAEARLDVETYLEPQGFAEPRSLHAAMQYCRDRLMAAGIEPYWIDLTSPGLGIPVARVFAEGLRSHWRMLAPGRLYDVPVKLGWLERPLDQHELNPRTCFL